MSTKKISAGDTLTVGDLTDDHLGAVIEVGPKDGVTYRFRLNRIERDEPRVLAMWTAESGIKCAYLDATVTVITPPPVVQPDEPTTIGQCIRIKGLPEWLGVVVDPPGADCKIRDTEGYRWSWVSVLDRAGDRQIIVSDPPRWPDETPDVPERIEKGEWPDDDTYLRAWEWRSVDHRFGDDHTARWNDQESQWECLLCDTAWRRGGQRKYAWTRGERVK